MDDKMTSRNRFEDRMAAILSEFDVAPDGRGGVRARCDIGYSTHTMPGDEDELREVWP